MMSMTGRSASIPVQVVKPIPNQNSDSSAHPVKETDISGTESPLLRSSDLGNGSLWKKISEVPYNVRDFSIEQLARSLELLQMPRLAAEFRDQYVDGQLLMTIVTEESLINDFHCTVFEANKVMQFAKNNWRPK